MRPRGPWQRIAIAWVLGLSLVGAPSAVRSQGPPAASLAGRLLVATPYMRDPRFVESVIYLVRHDASGALGLVVNRPVQQIDLVRLLDHFGMGSAQAEGGIVVHWGGPVDAGKAFVLHTPDFRADGTVVVKDRIAFTGNRGILEAMAARTGPRRLLFAIGYAGWGPGQLEAELSRGGWLTATAEEELLFDADHATKWRRATARRLTDL